MAGCGINALESEDERETDDERHKPGAEASDETDPASAGSATKTEDPAFWTSGAAALRKPPSARPRWGAVTRFFVVSSRETSKSAHAGQRPLVALEAPCEERIQR